MNNLVEILKEISWEIWQKIVLDEPEWKLMATFLNRYRFGPYSVLMLILGLNDYQLKGRAEDNYWPPLRRLLNRSPVPTTATNHIDTLKAFYERERLHTQKLERLEKFLNCALATQLWAVNPTIVAHDFLVTWNQLSEIMGQRRKKKIIVFAMKCLGIALMQGGEYGFDFSPIPNPWAEDVLDIVDVESAVLNGRILRIERDDLRGTKYVIRGTAADRRTPVGVVGRFTSTGRYLIITVYEAAEMEE